MKVFISQPMNGRSDVEILAERGEIANYLSQLFPSGVEIIDSWLGNCNKGPVWCLGESIKLMQEADLVVLAPGWDKARGCKIEYEVSRAYGIKAMEFV